MQKLWQNDIQISRKLDDLLHNFEEEVLKVVSTMGKWKPGIQNNKPCKSLLEIPIVFSL